MIYLLIFLIVAALVGFIIWRLRRPKGSIIFLRRRGIDLRLTQIKGDPLNTPINRTLYGGLVMGRDSDCDIVVPDDSKVSRKHCELVRQKDEVFIRDLDSKNGTLVNGVPIGGTHKLENDDTIGLGNIEYRLSILEPPT